MADSTRPRTLYVFGLFWVTVFALYLPAAKAGWVDDTMHWLTSIEGETFKGYINRMQVFIPSMYQFTQFITYIFYKLFHTDPWLWHILFITLQAINATLLFTITHKIFSASAVKNATAISFCGAFLFCICPHISEVIVWKASFHYLQGMLLTLSIIYWTQKYLSTMHIKYAWFSSIVFFLSTFSLEFFYLTPWFILSLVIYYYVVLDIGKRVFIRALLFFVVPLFLLFIVHLVLLRLVTGFYVSHLGTDIQQPITEFLRKPPSYLFNNLFLGRFYPEEIKKYVYYVFTRPKGLIAFYGTLIIVCSLLLLFFRKLTPAAKSMMLIFFWLAICIAIVCPMWLSDIQYVRYDRYSYYMLPFIYILFSYFLIRFLNRKAAYFIIALYAVVNGYFTWKVNTYWKQSADIVYNLSHKIPDPGNKIILLLNLPANLNGVPMIGSLAESAFKEMYNVNNPKKLNNTVYDVVSYNMVTPADGAHVAIYGDSLLHVTLNQWGTWWWYSRLGAASYENEAYKMNLMDPGHWYELVLKHPLNDYLLLYQVGDTWKKVDVNNKNVEQY